jgi:hypothetical protein
VSLYLAVNEDKILEQMIAEALDETMAMIEARTETKVRKGYQQDNRVLEVIADSIFIPAFFVSTGFLVDFPLR